MLIVVSAPSGGGKTTLCDMLRKDFPSIEYSVSCTTRKPRGNEVDGVHYHFLSEEAFAAHVARGDFLEHAVVHGCRYGTLGAGVAEALRQGRSVLMDIDVQGAKQIRDRVRAAPAGDILKKGFLDIFIAPPSLEALRQRLVKRAEDKPEIIERRLCNAEIEMRSAGEYRYLIVNDALEKAYAALKELIGKEFAS